MKNNQPIFIVGYPRSGTSLLRVILDSHPDLSIGPELNFVEKIIKHYPKTFVEFLSVADKAMRDYSYSQDEVETIFKNSPNWFALLSNWCSFYAEKRNRRVWGEKTPQSYKYLDKIFNKFPDAVYIYIVRNPFDVMGSLKSKGWYKGVKSILSWCYSNFRAGLIVSENSIFIKYEDFVASPEEYINKILDLAQLDNKYNLLKEYQNVDHGRIAKGDIWNKPIVDADITQKRNLLDVFDKFFVYLFCSYYLIKYKYM